MNIKKINWSKDYDQFIDYLYSLNDSKYKEFSKKITPGEYEMIGIRVPILKELAKSIYKETNYKEFLSIPNGIYEIQMLKCFVIANIKDIDEYKEYFNSIISSINNWAVCDTFLAASKTIKKDKPYFYNKSIALIRKKDEFLNRIGFVIMLDYFIIDEYIDNILKSIKDFKSDKYYANMALAWLISVCYIKYPTKTKQFLENNSLDTEVIKMAIRKIKDSYRVSDNDKKYLKKLLTI